MSDSTRQIRLLCLDVDGVLTDGGIHIDDRGIETKRFHVRDGTGLRIWTGLGYHAAIITGRRGMAVRHRANELGIRHVIQGSSDKPGAFGDLLTRLDLRASEAAMLGDDLPDLSVLKLCGYPMAVADAVPEVRRAAAFVTTAHGGRGAVREAVEHLLKERDEWEAGLQLFS